MKTILVSGTSSGIGYEICVQALKLKYKVISVQEILSLLKILRELIVIQLI